MKAQKIVITYGNGYSVTVDNRAEAAKKVKQLLADYVFVAAENVSLKIEETQKDIDSQKTKNLIK